MRLPEVVSRFLRRWKPSPISAPLGPDAELYYGNTRIQNTLAPAGQSGPPSPTAPGNAGPPTIAGGSPEIVDVLALLVDSRDNRYTGTPAQLTAYRDTKHATLSAQLGPYWREASFDAVDVALAMRDELHSMRGTFDDYFNRDYVAASLTSSGLNAVTWPRTYDGTATATLHVRDSHDRNIDVTIAPNGTFANVGQLSAVCQAAFDAAIGVPAAWVNCTAIGGELKFELVQTEVREGSFIRVRSGNNLVALGLEGPLEAPGDSSSVASLTGKPVPGGFPVSLPGGATIELEIRDKNLRTRRHRITLPAGTTITPSGFAALVPPLNAEFTWVQAFDPGPNRLGLRLLGAFSGPNAAVRVVGGSGLAPLGLDGPRRVDGVIHFDGRLTVRGNAFSIVGEALSLHIARRAADAGIPISAARETDLNTLVSAELGHIESFLVLFVESMTGIPTDRRAGALSQGYYNLSIQGAGGYTYRRQVSAGLMIGDGSDTWQTWAHELGHVLGFWDLYAQSFHDAHFDRKFDYVREWEIMDTHPAAAHVGGWHKLKRGWLTSIAEVTAPAAGATDTHRFTLAPIEFRVADYAATDSAAYPLQHLVRIRLTDRHWILVENRQPGTGYSQQLPDDTVGAFPPDFNGEPGGVFVTDTIDPFQPALYRSAVTTLNPHGAGTLAGRARGMKQGDILDLSSTYPAYDGIVIRVVDTILGPAGMPEALRVEVEWGPGDFVELDIRNWEAPSVYGTHDIWIDWPGNGEENYPAPADPPLGNGDPTHWHPDGSVSNKVKVRVHNRGTVQAQGVVVRAYVNTPMGMGDRGTFVPFPDSTPQDIAPSSFADFVFDWRPKQAGHTCIRAEIFTHASALSDLDLTNNAGQENVADFHPVAGSPYDPFDFTFKLNSDYDQPIRVAILPTGLVDGMDLEVERNFVVLAPDEEIELRARLHLDETKIPPNSREEPKTLRFNLHAFVSTQDSWLPFGGITGDVHPSYRSKLRFIGIERLRNREDIVVKGILQGPYRAAQPVDVALVASNGMTYEGTASTNSTGRFEVPITNAPSGPARVMLYYFGPSMAASYLGPVQAQVPQ
jgi:M6 family metalloprotease-like protein